MQQISPSPPSSLSPLLLNHGSGGRRGACRAFEKTPCSALVLIAAASSSSAFSSCLLVHDPPPRLSPLLFLLPPIKSSSKLRLPSLLPLKCRHLRDLDILSVKELPDGSLHFSFGILNETNELSFKSGEYFTNKMAPPCRPPSRFVRQSPIPVVTARRRKEQDVTSVKEGALNSAPGSMLLFRPKSCFVKRSPISKPTNAERKLFLDQKVTNDGTKGNVVDILDITNGDKVKRWPSRFIKRSPIPLPHGKSSIREEAIVDSTLEMLEREDKQIRWPSKFVKRSPIPSVPERSRKIEVKAVNSTVGVLIKADKPNRWPSRFIKRSPIPSVRVRSNNQEKRGLGSTVEVHRNAIASETCRPKSKFVRRSALAKTHPNSSAVSRVEISGDSNSVQSSRPKSAFIKKSPIIKVHHHALLEAGVEEEPQGELSSQKTIVDSNASEVSGIGKQLTDRLDDNVVDLDKCKLPELKSLAKTRGLKGYSKLRKAELLVLLKGQR